MSTPTTSIPIAGRARGLWRPGPHPTSSSSHAGLEPENLVEERHLLIGALGERVPEVGASEMVGQGLEPVVPLRLTVCQRLSQWVLIDSLIWAA
jgi:hypothetical protein